jgi:hypothetical protein
VILVYVVAGALALFLAFVAGAVIERALVARELARAERERDAAREELRLERAGREGGRHNVVQMAAWKVARR